MSSSAATGPGNRKITVATSSPVPWCFFLCLLLVVEIRYRTCKMLVLTTNKHVASPPIFGRSALLEVAGRFGMAHIGTE